MPRSADGDLAGFLADFGPGVIAIEFGTNDLEGVIERASSSGSIDVKIDFDPLGMPERQPRHRIASRHLAGFDVVLGQAEHVVL